MNKQEAIEKIEKILLLPTDDVDPSYDLGYNNGLRKAKSIIEKIELEKPEKQYTAKLKIIINGDNNYLNKHSDTERFTLSNLYTASGAYQTSFTQSELKKLNVWNNPVFEIEEVSNE